MTMTRRLAVVMDPIRSIKPYKDTTLALLLAATRAGYALEYLELSDLWLRDGVAMGAARPLEVFDDPQHWFRLGEPRGRALGEFDVILMRVDPPFDLEYVTATWILERAEAAGALVVNRPQALRDCSEKLYTAWFADLTPPTLFSRDMTRLAAFHAEHGDVIYKPIDGMGGSGVFRIAADGMNLRGVIEQLTGGGRHTIVAQRYLPAISDGDKRLLMIDGEPLPHVLARIPQRGETRGNLAAGGHGEVRPLGAAERRIAERVGPELRRRGLLFVGLDVIGDRLTEINVTSPTCAREIAAATGVDAADRLITALDRRLAARPAARLASVPAAPDT
jgi:glutathione synthase (EC 6.3.2.3)